MSSLPTGFTDEETFSCWLPCQAVITKGAKGSKKPGGKRWIQGIASTGSKDLEGEIVNQHGIDFSYFLKSGYLNWDHKPGAEFKIGQPTECRVTKQGLFIKGFLFEGNPQADAAWNLMHSLDISGANRRMGLSIEGKVKRRAGSDIKECWIKDIAVTPAPVNHTTWCEMAKSLSAQTWDLSKGCEDDDYNNDNEEIEEKALSVGGGSPLVPESMGAKVKEDRTSKSLTFDEAVDSIMKSQEIPRDAAESIARIAFTIFS